MTPTTREEPNTARANPASDLINRVCPRFASGTNEIASAGCCGRPRGGRPPLATHSASDHLINPVRTRLAGGANEITAARIPDTFHALIAQPARELRRAS